MVASHTKQSKGVATSAGVLRRSAPRNERHGKSRAVEDFRQPTLMLAFPFEGAAHGSE